MSSYVTRFISDIERGVSCADIEAPLTHALNDPMVVDFSASSDSQTQSHFFLGL